jgi:hypothetical protein
MGHITEKELAEWLHEQYEEIAKEKGWKTQESTQTKFDNLPKKNQQTMIELAFRILRRFKLNIFGRFWN